MARIFPLAAVMVVLLPLSMAGRSAAGTPDDDPVFRGLAERSWILSGTPRVFHSADLYEEIDGEAELFIPYDFLELKVAYVSRKATPEAQFRLELYRHGSPRDAFGIFSQHRFPGQDTLQIGPSEAIVSDASLDFFRGDRFVRIRTNLPGGARGDLIELGRNVSSLLDGSGAPPPETRALLVPGFVPGTLVFQKRAILGYDALAPGYEAKFSAEEVSGSLLLLAADKGRSPAPVVERLGGGLPGFAKIAAGLFRAELPGKTLWLLESGPYLVGIAGTLRGEQAESLLSVMAGKLRDNR